MKKIVMVVAAAAALSIPLFAENKVGKITGIQVGESNATISLAEGLLNPFDESGFTKSGDSSVTVPLDVAVEFYFPRRGRLADDRKAEARPQKEDVKEDEAKKDEAKRPEFPTLNVKNLRIDQLVQVVFAEDGKTVEKIQLQPMMPAFQPGMAKAFPGRPGANGFNRDGNGFNRDGNFKGNFKGDFPRRDRNSKGDGNFNGKDPAHPTPQWDRR